MVNRESALAAHYHTGHSGLAERTGVTLTEVRDLGLLQIAAWPNTLSTVAKTACSMAGCTTAPAPGKAIDGSAGSLLRVEPLKCWLVSASGEPLNNTEIDAEQGSTLDLSHSRTHVRITGEDATKLLNRHLPLDLRAASFPVGSVASTAFHHVGVTLWHSSAGFELFLPRGFAVSLWEGLVESAEQFGLEII